MEIVNNNINSGEEENLIRNGHNNHNNQHDSNSINKRSHLTTLPHPDNDLHLHDDRKRKKISKEE